MRSKGYEGKKKYSDSSPTSGKNSLENPNEYYSGMKSADFLSDYARAGNSKVLYYRQFL